MMDAARLFQELLHAECEEDVERVLEFHGLLNDDEAIWTPVGGLENNFGAIGNQQSDPTGAMVEKVVNAIDAMLMAKCYEFGIDPEGPAAPRTMADAVERFFGVRDGKIANLLPRQQGELAQNISLVAVGDRLKPNYLVIDRGEGQTPQRFPDTFLSLMRSNKIRIPFVQGKFNAGGTGVLQFCGSRNFQLICSRRNPSCPVDPADPTANMWGFTIVRRLLPAGGRRSSMYVYLAPGGSVPMFSAESIKVLPGESRSNQPAAAYAGNLDHGTCIKLYNYRWKTRSILTTDGRYELERFLQSSCLPFRVVETRDYRGHYYAATVTGGWTRAVSTSEDGVTRKLEDGFPADAKLVLDGIGELPYQIAVFKQEVKEDVPQGVAFVLNGQVHGYLPSDFVSRSLKFDYLSAKNGPLLVLVDCIGMDERVREDFFMASRDRVRRNEVYNTIRDNLIEELRAHPGLQALNQLRRKRELEKHLAEETPVDAFQKLLQTDPTLSNLFRMGDHLVGSTGPGEPPPYIGRRFPTFFRLAKGREGWVKGCPVNRTCRVEFETDAENDYFSRATEHGEVFVDPPNLLEHNRLWNGRFETRFRVPWDARPGDTVPVTVTVTDISRVNPFVMRFTLLAEPEASDEPHSGPRTKPQVKNPNGGQTRTALAMPNIVEISKEEWDQQAPPFTKFDALQVKHDGQGGFDFLLNIDNTFLLTELSRAKETDRPLVKYWFKYGLVLAALGMLKHAERKDKQIQADGKDDGEDDDNEVDVQAVSLSCSGLAQVIVPIIRSLHSAQVE
jgi:hypothetical protein